MKTSATKIWSQRFSRNLTAGKPDREYPPVLWDKINKIERRRTAPGLIKTIKVYVAMKRKIAVGAKVSGRDPKQGIALSSFLKRYAFMEDGSPVDMC